jgi:hypothetical protein
LAPELVPVVVPELPAILPALALPAFELAVADAWPALLGEVPAVAVAPGELAAAVLLLGCPVTWISSPTCVRSLSVLPVRT